MALRRRLGPAALGGAWVCGALLLGALQATLSAAVSPFALPVLACAAMVAAVAVRRPEIGVTALLVLTVATTFGVPAGPVRSITAAAAFGLLALVLLAPDEDRASRHGLPRGLLPALGFGAAMLVAAVPMFGAEGEVRVLRVATGIALLVVTSDAVRRRPLQATRTLLAGAALGGALVGAHALWEYLTGNTTEGGFVTSSGEIVGRATGGFAQPNQLAGFLIVSVPLAVAGARLTKAGRPWFVLAAALGAAGVYVSFSRASLIALVASLLLVLSGRQLRLLPVILAAGLLLSGDDLLRERFATLTASAGEVSTRIDFWRAAADLWSANPVMGIGLGGFADAYSLARIPDKPYLPQTLFEPPPHAHNVFLNLMAEAGTLGLVAFVVLLWTAAAAALRLRRVPDRLASVVAAGVLGTLLAFTVHNLFDVTLDQSETVIYFWTTLGLLSGTVAARAGGP